MSKRKILAPGESHRRARSAEHWELQLKRQVRVTASECWEWTGQMFKETGYGKWRMPGVRESYAHRWVYLLMVGPIPDGMEIDHLCRNRACCNPAHLEAVPHQVNSSRGETGKATGARNRSKTHCRNGHEYTAENTYRNPEGHRSCRECQRQVMRNRYWHAKSEMAAHD